MKREVKLTEEGKEGGKAVHNFIHVVSNCPIRFPMDSMYLKGCGP